MAKRPTRPGAPTKTDIQQRFIEMRAQGYTYAEIAKELAIPVSTLGNWNKALEASISHYRAVELDTLYKAYFMSQQTKIELLGAQLNAVLAELATRDLKEVSTANLYGIMFELQERLDRLYIEPRPIAEEDIKLIEGSITHE